MLIAVEHFNSEEFYANFSSAVVHYSLVVFTKQLSASHVISGFNVSFENNGPLDTALINVVDTIGGFSINGVSSNCYHCNPQPTWTSVREFPKFR